MYINDLVHIRLILYIVDTSENIDPIIYHFLTCEIYPKGS